MTGKNFPDFFEQTPKYNEIDELNEEINKLRSTYPLKSEFVKQLINTGIRLYNSGDFYAAGFYFERAIKEGDEGVTAKNNLAFMIRRDEYISETYSFLDLLQPGIDINDTFANINMTLYYAKMGQWEIADSYIQSISQSAKDIEEAKNWWNSLSLENEPEGFLVLVFLARYKLVENSFDTVTYLEKISNSYDAVPSWIFEPATQKISGSTHGTNQIASFKIPLLISLII